MDVQQAHWSSRRREILDNHNGSTRPSSAGFLTQVDEIEKRSQQNRPWKVVKGFVSWFEKKILTR